MSFKPARKSLLRPLLLAALAGAFFNTAAFAKSAAGLHYLKAGQPNAAEVLAPPPLPGSAEEAADLALVVSVSKACSSNDIMLAFSEKKFSVFNFTPAVGELFRPERLQRTAAFFERVQADAAAAADGAKEYWKRPRPYTLNPSLASGKLEKSFSYPSGHATEGMVLALVLAELLPEQRVAILAVGRGLGWHRVGIGRHYATDIYAGRVFAQAIVRAMEINPDFQHDFADAKAEMAAAAAAGGSLPGSATPVTTTR